MKIDKVKGKNTSEYNFAMYFLYKFDLYILLN